MDACSMSLWQRCGAALASCNKGVKKSRWTGNQINSLLRFYNINQSCNILTKARTNMILISMLRVAARRNIYIFCDKYSIQNYYILPRFDKKLNNAMRPNAA